MDQSYFLHRLTQARLARTLFPISGLARTEVWRIAEVIGLPNARKKGSTGICFIGERPFREFPGRYFANRPGADHHRRQRLRARDQALTSSANSACRNATSSAIVSIG